MQKYSRSFPNTRLRRVRQSSWVRDLIAETSIAASDLIWPVFIEEGSNVKRAITSMPGVYGYSIDNLLIQLINPNYDYLKYSKLYTW